MYQQVIPSIRKSRAVNRLAIAPNRAPFPWQRAATIRRAGPIQSPGQLLYGSDATLGFSLNPLNLLKSGIKAVGSIFKNSTVTLPTSSGPVTVKGSDLGGVIRGASVNVAGTEPPSAMERITSGVEAIPGGWITLAGVGIGAIVLTSLLARRR